SARFQWNANAVDITIHVRNKAKLGFFQRPAGVLWYFKNVIVIVLQWSRDFIQSQGEMITRGLDGQGAVAVVLIPPGVIVKIMGRVRSCSAVCQAFLLRFLFCGFLLALKLLEAA